MPARSVVYIVGEGVAKWFHLSKGRDRWALRDFLDGDGTASYYLRNLADFPGHIETELSLLEVQKRTGLPATSLSATLDAHRPQWRLILQRLSAPEGPPVQEGQQGGAGNLPPRQAAVAAAGNGPDPQPPRLPTTRIIPVTEMRSLYTVVQDFTRREFQLAMAREAARVPVPERLANRFRASVEQFSRYSNIVEPFYPQIRPDLPLIARDAVIQSTTDLTCHLCQHSQSLGIVGNDRDLDFELVDREIIPSRTTEGAVYANGAPATHGKRLDWLLRNAHDHTLVIGEVKIRADKNPFVALIQGLLYAAELVTNAQRERLVRHYDGKFQFPKPADSDEVDTDPRTPACDIYVVLHEYNWDAEDLCELFQATQTLAERLLQHEALSGHIRRIACLDAQRTEDGGLVFSRLFRFGG